MPTIIDQAIVVRVWDWSETSQTVSLFTRGHGLIRGIAKGARREKGRFSGGLDLLTRGEVVAIIKPSTDLATLTEWDLLELFPATRRDLRAHYAGLYFVDLARHFLTDADPHPALWDRLLEALRALREGADPGPPTLAFQWAALSEAGFRPDLAHPASNARDTPSGQAPATRGTTELLGFDPRIGRLTPDPGHRVGFSDPPWRVRERTLRLLRVLEGDGDPAAAPRDFDPAPEDVDRANRLLAAYARWVLGREPPSMRVLFGAGAARPRPPAL